MHNMFFFTVQIELVNSGSNLWTLHRSLEWLFDQREHLDATDQMLPFVAATRQWISSSDIALSQRW